MSSYQIPLSAGAQSFSIVLGGVQYRMTLIYREAAGGGWFLDMVRADGTDAVYGIPLVLGADLLAQYDYKGFGHLHCSLSAGKEHKPDYEDVGSTLTLIWSEDE